MLLHAQQTFKNPKPALLAVLKETGPIPGEENGVKGSSGKKGGPKTEDGTPEVKKKKRGGATVTYPRPRAAQGGLPGLC